MSCQRGLWPLARLVLTIAILTRSQRMNLHCPDYNALFDSWSAESLESDHTFERLQWHIPSMKDENDKSYMSQRCTNY